MDTANMVLMLVKGAGVCETYETRAFSFLDIFMGRISG